MSGDDTHIISLIFILPNQTKKTVRKVLLSCVVFACLLCLRAGAQTPLGLPYNLQQSTTTSLPSTTEYYLEVDTTYFDIGQLTDSDLTGFNTYRIYVATSNPLDQVSAVYGNIYEPTELVSTGQIFQSSPLGEVTPNGIIPATWSSFPSNEFDSFITIGIDGPASDANGEGDINIIESTANPWTEGFEPESGEFGTGIVMNDITGGSWFVLPNFNNGTAGENQRVLVAQITTNGTLSGNLHIQLFLNGDNINGTVYLNLPMPIFDCLDPNACNWNPDSSDPSGQCTYPEEGLDCDGFCLFDADDDGICDADEVLGCTDPEASNYDLDATNDDGTCNVFGCTDSSASNYNPTATHENGTCVHTCTGIAGCVYPDAENYSPEANCDNGTCTFDCGSPDNCMFDQDGNGLIGSYDLVYFLTLFGMPCAP